MSDDWKTYLKGDEPARLDAISGAQAELAKERRQIKDRCRKRMQRANERRSDGQAEK